MQILFLMGTVFFLAMSKIAKGWQSNYLASLSRRTEHFQSETTNDDAVPDSVHQNDKSSVLEPPDEWYGKSRPMASWAGWKHAQWGGYLENLSPPSTDVDNDVGS